MSPSLESLPHQHTLLLNSLTRRQHGLIKGHIIDMENYFNKVLLSFDPINPKFFPSNRIIDTHANHFSFHLFNKHISHNIKYHIQELNKIALESLNVSSSALVITDASIKNNVAISIAHIHIHDKPITKTLYYALNITSTEAELFSIRCGINQVTNNCTISKIIVVMDSIHVVQEIFDLSSHPFQKHLLSILKDLQTFFSCHSENHIKFWECPSHCNWYLHKVINTETKSFRPIPMFPSKLLSYASLLVQKLHLHRVIIQVCLPRWPPFS